MGLAASQARLLSITKRISDNELRAQLINNQKMRLATESSKVSENYINALNSTNLMFTNYGVNDARQTVPLTYNELTAFNQYNNQYVLSDVAGSVFLREDEARLYAENRGDLAGYLSAHGIEYMTTYWEAVGNTLPEEELLEAAVVKAWYETKGIDATAGIGGLEGCSIFPELEQIADRIRVEAGNLDTDVRYRSQLISQATSEMVLGSSFHSWFSDAYDNVYNGAYTHWLRWGERANGTGTATAGNSLWVFHDFLDNFIVEGGTDASNAAKQEFDNIYTALWNFGNNKPIDLSSIEGTKWHDRLSQYDAPVCVIDLETFWNGNGTAPTQYLKSTYNQFGQAPDWSDYLFYHASYSTVSNQTGYQGNVLSIRLPGHGIQEVSHYDYDYELDDWGNEINEHTDEYLNPAFTPCSYSGYNFYKWTNSTDNKTYYIPSNETSYNNLVNQYGGGIIVGDDNGDFPSDALNLMGNLPDRKTQATQWIQEAIKDYIKKQLNLGDRIQTDGQIDKFHDMGFTDYQIDVINNLVNSSDLSELKKEFFNLLLGSPNLANYWHNDGTGQNDNEACVYSDYWHSEGLVKTVDWIVDSLNNLEYTGLTSRALVNLGIVNTATGNIDYDELRDIFINGYAGQEYGGTSYTAQDILDLVWADLSNSWGSCAINNSPAEWNLNENLLVMFPNYSQLSNGNVEGVDAWTVMERYGMLPQVWSHTLTDSPHSLNDDGRLLMEFVYPAAIDFFNRHGMPVYGYMKQNASGQWEDASAEAEWYTNLFNKVEECGYKTLERGLASSTDWIRFALENGVAIVEQLNTVDTWNKITYNSCSDITEETDSRIATLAEAEYNKSMNQIQAKDERLDLELKNIDTEHSALQKEYESVQKAMTDNVTRTFKMYS